MRNRPRTSARTQLTDALFQQAKSMMNDGISIRQAAKAIGFSEGALRKRLKTGKGSQQLGKTSVARIMGFNRVQLNNYFNNLETVMEKYGFSSDRLYNMDETGVQTVPNKLPKHVAPKGKREVGKSVAAEQGQTVTVVCSMSAVGHHIPPFFIFSRKRINPQLINGGPTGCDMAVTDKGYMTSATFIIWLKHFQKFTHPTVERPVLLILDNHISHVSLEAITYAKENHIIMLSLPPHSSHRTQPP
ncbi:uncharacterized protein LOC120351048 [Nilaparvata lugens]|uniref:uncharacterized protein LOC120351048 n=1 Tax=Nilaparvata lugens TaxID=108931 RepID=UPI00193CCAE3|nr:uncharacterized protein LOC120351048 [Nilaparvata lugens]